ncbi:RNA-binding region RNP-1 domain-containing protein [Tieghemostelium lacteum]|uniref:RNA-binding region RNP-1 domain-containing protein n=1 Tax=Tieghemostelium lacteum TaxID=361077 RepID=A0A151ZS10_TIELA|nr:RNA-binding region RNP-1 domain-containing protein [Tieghemostelium lacteum]|eukprot:KYQ96783.1 RNA-binding region RNP-1 domain-containing protein [Tieghemostelium lacteum]
MSSNLPQERNIDACIQVRDLDPMVTEDLVLELMIQAAPVVKIFMPKDKLTGQHSGKAFVEFQSESDAEYVMKIMKFVKLYGKPIKLKKESKDKVDIGANLFIGNLDAEVDERTLYETFLRFGNILFTPKIMRDPQTGVSKGYGFLSYDNFSSSDAAIEAMNGEFLCNKPISVTYARKKDSQEKHGSKAERTIAASKAPNAPPHMMMMGAPPPPPILSNMNFNPSPFPSQNQPHHMFKQPQYPPPPPF